MNKCDCYRTRTERRYFSDYEKGYAAAQGRLLPDYEDVCEGVCLGTKEVDRCSCDGDRSKCDFMKMCVGKRESKARVQTRPRNKRSKKSKT